MVPDALSQTLNVASGSVQTTAMPAIDPATKVILFIQSRSDGRV